MKQITTRLDFEAARKALEGHHNLDGVCLSPKQVLRVLALCIDTTASTTMEDRKPANEWRRDAAKRCPKKNLEMYYSDYIKILEIIDGNPVLSFVYEPIPNGRFNPIRIAVINPEYLLNEEFSYEVPEKEYKELIVCHRNKSKLGVRSCSNDGISINADEELLRSEIGANFREKNDRSDEQLLSDVECQLNIIRKINSTGTLDPKRANKEARVSSRYTCLCSVVNKYVQIDDEKTVEMDQHATYFTLLPQVLIRRTEKNLQTDEFWREITGLKRIVAEEPNIYEYISSKTGTPVKDIKKVTNSYFCDWLENRTLKSLINEFFRVEFPFLHRYSIPNLRWKNGPYSEFNRIESFIFSGAARELIKLGVKAITKYDSLLVKTSDLELAKRILNERFNLAGVPNRTKIKESPLDNNRLKNTECLESLESLENIEIEETHRETTESRSGRESGVAHRRHCADFSKKSCLSVQKGSLSAQNPHTEDSLSVQRSKASKITVISDGRYRCSIKNVKYNSRKWETLEQFTRRMIDSGAILAAQ